MSTNLPARSRAIAAVLFGALTVSAFLAGCDAADPSPRSAPTALAPTANVQSQIALCHRTTSPKNPYKLEFVDAPAVPDHEAHGDKRPGDAYPHMSGYVFGEACEPAEPYACLAEAGTDGDGRSTLTITVRVFALAFLPVNSGYPTLDNAEYELVDVLFELVNGQWYGVGAVGAFAQADPSRAATASMTVRPNIVPGGPTEITCGPYAFGAPSET